MDNNLKKVLDLKIERTIENLNKNGMIGHRIPKGQLIGLISELVTEGSQVTVGGSMTLHETGVIDYLKTDRFEYLDRYAEGLTPEQIKDLYIRSFGVDAYFTSSNAITEDGKLYNVDGRGNRVAAMIFGPDKVIVVASANKIVKNIDDAIQRNREISAPANCVRLDRKTPCAVKGHCMDCDSPDRICSSFVVMEKQMIPNRIHVIIIDDAEFGY